ncbi:probable rRNA-processing protein EBP2 [Caerostris extrusa]|uniref:Probable rRNA-processing protein EBP2 n=1 Tax=Caerostris extrusa TaxID=172846 RepID=A0AAV4XK08_CAEEX|nr:probable rRNA-processing protein EBP2 [Caerostris extrusa]
MSDLSDASVEDDFVTNIPSINSQKRKIIPVNNVAGLQAKLKDFQLNGDWLEKLDVSVKTSAPELETSNKKSTAVDTEAEHDFKREMIFYNQALAGVNKALKRLKKIGIPTKRPEDFFAEMAKSDNHMKKVREKLLNKKMVVERTEKIRAIRDQKKQGKKIQREVIENRKKEKKQMINALKKTKKGKMDAGKLLGEKNGPGKFQGEKNGPGKFQGEKKGPGKQDFKKKKVER